MQQTRGRDRSSDTDVYTARTDARRHATKTDRPTDGPDSERKTSKKAFFDIATYNVQSTDINRTRNLKQTHTHTDSEKRTE